MPLSFPLYLIVLGSFKDPHIFWKWEGNCQLCGGITTPAKDLFCGNFGASRGTSHVCRKSWHARCYTASSLLTFKIATPENDEGVQWRKQSHGHHFLSARRGDMLTSPFQCDYCWFFNITKRVARDIFNSDARLLAYIRRVNLDVFWSREPSTVANTMRALSKAKTLSDELGLPPVQLTVGPWPVVDTCGFQIAIEILKSSQRPGRNDSTYTQFDSIRKLRSAYLTIYDSSPARCLENGCLKNDRGQISYFIDSPTQSKLFTMFMHGCEKRMGRMVKQDMGLSFDMLVSLL